MKKLLIILFPFLLTAQNVWYVNRDTPQRDNPTGQNGRSWATAWQDLDSVGYWTDGNGVNWNLISAGDTIYMSGGTDSTTYTPEDHTEGVCVYGMTMVYSGNFSFAGGNPVVIAPAWHPNHNGDVYFVTRDDTLRSATATSTQLNRLVDNTANFVETLVGNRVWNVDSSKNSYATIDTVVSSTILALSNHIIQSGQDYLIIRPQQRALDIVGVSNVKFVNMKFYNLSTPYFSSSNVVSLGDASNTTDPDSLITFENCTFWTRGSNAQIGMGSTKTTIKNCTFDMEESSWINDNDAMGFSGGRGGHTIDGNTFIFRNSDLVGSAHRDCMQFSNFGQRSLTERLTTRIMNNLIIDTKPNGEGWNGYIYSSGPYCNQTFYIYNNIFVHRKQDSSPVPIFMYHPDCEPEPAECDGTGSPYGNYREEFGVFNQSYHILNNTFIMKGVGSGPITTVWSDTTIVKNNIFVVDTINIQFYNLDGTDGYPESYKEIDYNLIAEKYGVSASIFGFDNGIDASFTTWRGTLNYDVNSDTMDAQDLTYVEKYGFDKADYYITSNIGNGTDLSATYSFLANDALGNPRSATGWLGALDKNDYGAGVDSLPAPFTYFEDVTNAELSTLCFAQTGDLVDFDSAWVRIDRGQYNINGGTWKNSDEWTEVFPNDDVYLRDTSSSEYSTSKSIILTVGSRSDTWTFTTKAEPSAAGVLRFSNGRIAYASNGEIISAGSSTYTPPSEPDTTAPSPPTSFVATGGSSQTQFQTSWTNPVVSDLDSIRYYEGSSNDTTTMVWIVSLPASTGYLRTGRTANTTYWCAVKAVDDSGNVSYFSNTDSATTLTNPVSGQPLQNLKMAYLSQSTAGHLFDHELYGEAGTTSMPDEMTAYNTLNDLAGYNAGSITKGDDYPHCGDMIWDWHEVFYGGTDHGNTSPTEHIVDDWLVDTTYSIFQVTFGFACGALDWYGWYQDASDTADWPTSLIGNNFKYYTRQMVYVMEQYPDKYFVLWTLYPPGTDYTDTVGLRMASQFGRWMKDTLAAGLDSYGTFPDNVMIFDIRTLLDSAYYLPDSYADSPIDPHPNADAASYIAPIYIQQVFDNARAYRRPD